LAYFQQDNRPLSVLPQGHQLTIAYTVAQQALGAHAC